MAPVLVKEMAPLPEEFIIAGLAPIEELVKSRSVDPPEPVYSSTALLPNSRFAAALEDWPIELAEPPLAKFVTRKVVVKLLLPETVVTPS